MFNDEIWKDVLEILFPSFIKFFHKELWEAIDFGKGYKFLEQELHQLDVDYGKDKRYVDKLVEVRLKNGKEKWLLIHIEVQGSVDNKFSERMFQYGYRIYDKYGRHAIGMAILSDTNKNFRPSYYSWEEYGTRWEYRYNTYKLLDYVGRELSEDNPFSLVVEAWCKSQESRKSEDLRKNFKRELLHLMYEYGHTREEIRALFIFIDGILRLSSMESEQIIYKEILEYERRKNMPYVTTFERIVLNKGKELGIREGKELGIREGKRLGIREGKELGLMEGKKQEAYLMIKNYYNIKYKTEVPISEEQALQLSADQLNDIFTYMITTEDRAKIDQYIKEAIPRK